MASGQQTTGRGRGRGRSFAHETQSSASNIPTMPSAPPPPSIAAGHLSSNTDDIKTTHTTKMSIISSRGRGHRILPRREDHIPDPRWTVSDLTMDQFKTNKRPSKPTELGTRGEPITVITNCFPVIQFPQEGLIYQYDLQIRNKKNRLITLKYLRILYECWLNNLCEKSSDMNRYKIVFDNDRTIFTYDQPLPNVDKNGITEMIWGPNKQNHQEEYSVCVKLVGNPVDLKLLRSLPEFYESQSNTNNNLHIVKRMLSVVLHENCSSQADFISNRSYFSLLQSQNRHDNWDLGLGKALRRGFSSCLVFTKGTHQLLMNLDVTHKVFMTKQPFLKFLCQIMVCSPCGIERYRSNRKIREAEIDDILEFLDPNISGQYYNGEIKYLLNHCRNLRVRSEVANMMRKYAVRGLGEAASKQSFYWQTKKDFITVENYYKEHYNIQLKYPSLPTLMMYKPTSQIHEEPYLPMELVNIEPMSVKKMDNDERATVSFQSIQQPADCYKSIQEIRQNAHQQCFEKDQYVTACDLKVATNMLKLRARVLTMPHVLCDEQYRVTHEQCQPVGVWNNTRTKFYTPANFPKVWALINLSSSLDKEACKKFYSQLHRVAKNRGMECPPPAIYEEYDVRTDTIEDFIYALKELMGKNDDCQFCIVILPEHNPIRDLIYAELKELCELEDGLGIVTQMVKLKEEEMEGQWNYSRLDYLCQKINTKLNGINSIIDVPDNIRQFFAQTHKTMYVGIDLSHPAPGSARKCSTVGVVASADDVPTKYFKEMYSQERPSNATGQSWEFIVDLKDIMKSLINQYNQHRNGPPKSIIIYRDGISTTEFDSVFEKELAAIREACIELSTSYRPYLTYIVAIKNHHIKFFLEDLKDNIPAGTVIDSLDITSPTSYDFFLASHHTTKGTSRPIHYHILYDDNKLAPDEVQMLTYALCYIYGRCGRSISVPAPVKYADLAAFRAAVYERTHDRSNENFLPQKSAIPINEDINVDNEIKSKRIVLHPKILADCPFFI